MATVTELPASTTTDPVIAGTDLFLARTGISIDEWHEVLATLTVEELESLGDLLAAVERQLLLQSPAVNEVLGRTEGVLQRVETLARRSANVI